MDTLHARLLKFQTDVTAVTKSKENPYHKSKYADINAFLDTIKPVLSACGLTITQPMEVVEGKMFMKTIVSDGKESISTCLPIPEVSDIQKLGAAITYLRRYSIQSLLALEAQDDDGNDVSINRFTPAHAKKIALISSIDELKDYYETNKGLGADFAKAITARKKELTPTVEDIAQAFGGEVVESTPAKLMKEGMKSV